MTNVQPVPKKSSPVAIVLMILSFIFACTVGLIGLIFMIITLMMGAMVTQAKEYDPVVAQVISSRVEDAGEDRTTITNVRYVDKEGNVHSTDISAKVNSSTVTIYCNPKNYNEVIYVDDLEGTESLLPIFQVVYIILLSVAGLCLVVGIVSAVVAFKKRK